GRRCDRAIPTMAPCGPCQPPRRGPLSPTRESPGSFRGFFDLAHTPQAMAHGGHGADRTHAHTRLGESMKLVIERGELMRALGHVTSVVERRTTIPILSNVLLKASGKALQFKATDLEREVQEEAPSDVSQPGAATVPAHILH